MDNAAFVKTLHSIFCNSNKTGVKYSEVWLSEPDFGGLYNNGKFVLNVKAEHHIPSCFDEIDSILELLKNSAPEEAKLIWAVSVYDPDDNIHCSFQDIEVYTESTSCP